MTTYSTKMVTLPLSPDQLAEFFKDKSTIYTIDFKKSIKVFQEKALLMYLSNLGICCDINNVNSELIKQYITLQQFPNIPSLLKIHANILYYVKYKKLLYPHMESLFNQQQIIEFCLNNTDIVAEQLQFLDSMILYLLTRITDKSLDQQESQDIEKLTDISKTQQYTTLIDDQLHDSIGFTLIQLITFEDFLICYSANQTPLNEQVYYTRFFDDNIYQGKNLFHYATKSSFFGLLQLIISSQNNDEQATSELNALSDCLALIKDKLKTNDK